MGTLEVVVASVLVSTTVQDLHEKREGERGREGGEGEREAGGERGRRREGWGGHEGRVYNMM